MKAIPFKNGIAIYALHMPYVIFKEYDGNFFVEDKPFPIDYKEPEFVEVRDKNGKFLYHEMLLADATKDFLKNLTAGNNNKLFLVRTAVRTVLTSVMDGNMHQSYYFVNGLSGTGKSNLVEILRMFVNSRYVRNFALEHLQCDFFS